jgi:hypothetical protein
MISDNSSSHRLSRELFSLVALELWHRAFLEGQKADPQIAPDSSLVATNQG